MSVRRSFACALALAAVILGGRAGGETLTLATKNLAFAIESDATAARFAMPANGKTDGDFWRLVLNDGKRTEMPVFSRRQKGRVTRPSEDVLEIAYDGLRTEFGDTYPIRFTVKAERRGEQIFFTPTVANGADVRVDECFAPLVAFDGIVGDRTKDVLYMPKGLGQRSPNPVAKMESVSHNYYSHNDKESFWHLAYPRASMCWMGVESGGRFLSVARQDPEVRQCFLSVRHTIGSKDLMLAVDHWPMAVKGETVSLPPTAVGLLDGDWRAGADDYRRWAESSFYAKPPEPPAWLRRMTGFSRLVMKSSFGEENCRLGDLVTTWRRTQACGLDALFLFAGWHAMPEEEIRRQLEAVRQAGGRTITVANFTFMHSDKAFWTKQGAEAALVDMWGEKVKPVFGYPGYGEFGIEYGKRSVTLGCPGAAAWRAHLLKTVRGLCAYGGDLIFMDCFGGAPAQGCFDARHEHGRRVDADWTFRRTVYAYAAEQAAAHGQAIGNEIVTDIAAAYSPFIHGLQNATLDPDSEEFPSLFRYTFPKLITTNRNMHGSRIPKWEEKLRSCLVYGLRYDAELYVCRRLIDEDPPYARVVKECTDLMRKYGEFYFDGTFAVVDSTVLPRAVKRGDFLNADGTKRLTVWYNTSKKPYRPGKGKLVLKPGELKFVVGKAETVR